jgi:hypothetical protein
LEPFRSSRVIESKVETNELDKNVDKTKTKTTPAKQKETKNHEIKEQEKKTLKKDENQNILFKNQILDIDKVMKKMHEQKEQKLSGKNANQSLSVEIFPQQNVKRTFEDLERQDFQVDRLIADFKRLKIHDKFEQKRLQTLEKKYNELEDLSQQYNYLKGIEDLQEIECGISALTKELPRYMTNLSSNDKYRFLVTYLLDTVFSESDLEEMAIKCIKPNVIQYGLSVSESFKTASHEVLEELLSKPEEEGLKYTEQ